MSKCSICQSPNLAMINDLLDSGAYQRDIAQRLGISRFSLSRHVKHSKAVAVPENGDGGGDSLEAQAARWLQRADDIYDRSIVDGDVRGQVQALTGAFRGLELQHRAELKAAEAAPAPGDSAPITIELLDEIIQRAIGNRRHKLIDRIFATPESTLASVEHILETQGELNENDPRLRPRT